MRKVFLSLAAAVLLSTLAACEEGAARKESNKVAEQQQQYVLAQPIPAFNWSLERHILIELYKARNNAVATYTYVRNQYTGKVMSSCKSIGFPISAATQLTAAEGMQVSNGNVYKLPQAEPNGVFPPATSRGTWVMCASKGGKATPRYYEEDVEAYVTEMVLAADGATLVEKDGAEPTVTIDVGH